MEVILQENEESINRVLLLENRLQEPKKKEKFEELKKRILLLEKKPTR